MRIWHVTCRQRALDSRINQGPSHISYTVAMIDCDIHHVIADQDDFLSYMDPGQREWFKIVKPLKRDR